VKIRQGIVSFNAALSACGNASEWLLGTAVRSFSTFARERKGTNGYYYNIMLYFMLFCVCKFHLGLLDKGRQRIFDLRFIPILFLRPQ